jgi:hypothetical protein
MSRLCASIPVLLALAGCSPNLGDAPFKCSGAGQCPDGYECNAARVCVRQGTCPTGVPGCAAGPAVCGDGRCSDDESCKTCDKDCGACTGAYCGDKACAGKETCETCAKDCGQCCTGDGCGGASEGGLPDLGPEPDARPPRDQGPQPDQPGLPDCTENDTKCDNKDTLRYCETGKWTVEACEALCKANGADYAVDCRILTQTGKDGCLCGKYAAFGEQCTDEVLCGTGLFCGAFSASATKGFCTKNCSNPGGQCTGAPPGTEATCSLEVGGQNVCAFICEDFYTDCPQPMVCDFDYVCKP